ncbi:MAG: DUF2971 domain-containing protein, partial [Devosia sp.]
MTDELQHLFKFRELQGQSLQRTRSIIEDSKLYFARPTEFNDPFDCLPRVSVESYPADRMRWFRDRLIVAHPDWSPAMISEEVRRVGNNPAVDPMSPDGMRLLRNALTTHMSKLGVLSLTARADHVLLWSHYANAHRGIALRFVATDQTEFFGEAQEVTYAPQRPTLNIFRQSVEQQV